MWYISLFLIAGGLYIMFKPEKLNATQKVIIGAFKQAIDNAKLSDFYVDRNIIRRITVETSRIDVRGNSYINTAKIGIFNDTNPRDTHIYIDDYDVKISKSTFKKLEKYFLDKKATLEQEIAFAKLNIKLPTKDKVKVNQEVSNLFFDNIEEFKTGLINIKQKEA